MLDLLLPQRCVVCFLPGDQLCGGCRSSLPWICSPLCARCGAPTAWPVARCRECAGRRLAFASARAAVRYDDSVRLVVAAWKERGLRRLAAPLARVVETALQRPDAACLTFVPPDRDRLLQRGHSTAERLALELGEIWSIPVEALLIRARSAHAQRGLTRAERRRNLAAAFAASREIRGRIGLVDDVYTTGATVAAAASALRSAGATRVDVVTFARAVRR